MAQYAFHKAVEETVLGEKQIEEKKKVKETKSDLEKSKKITQGVDRFCEKRATGFEDSWVWGNKKRGYI